MWSWLTRLAEEYIVAPVVLFILNSIWPPLYNAGQNILLFFLILPLWIIKFLEQAVDIFSGITPITTADGRMTVADYFIGQSVVTRAFWGITLIAAALCIGFSIIAVIRSMGDLDLKRPVGKVLGSVGRAMLTFLVIPFICIASISMAATVLRQTALMIETGGGRTQPVKVTSALFMVAAIEDSVYPTGPQEWTWTEERGFHMKDPVGLYSASEKLDRFNELKEAYLYGTKSVVEYIPDGIGRGGAGGGAGGATAPSSRQSYRLVYSTRDVGWSDMEKIIHDFDIYKLLYPGNLLVAVISSWFYVIMMFMILMVFIRRIYELILLYIVSPFFVSVIPLDEGEKFKNWRERFVSTVIAGFGSVFMVKIFILILPLIWDDGFQLHSNSLTNVVLKALLMCGGIFATYKSHTLISSIVSERGASSENESAGFALASLAMARSAATALPRWGFGLAKRDIENRILGEGRHSNKNNRGGGGGAGGGSSGNKNPNLGGGGSRPGEVDFSKYNMDTIKSEDAYKLSDFTAPEPFKAAPGVNTYSSIDKPAGSSSNAIHPSNPFYEAPPSEPLHPSNPFYEAPSDTGSSGNQFADSPAPPEATPVTPPTPPAADNSESLLKAHNEMFERARERNASGEGPSIQAYGSSGGILGRHNEMWRRAKERDEAARKNKPPGPSE